MANYKNNNPVLFMLYDKEIPITETIQVYDGRIDMGGLPDSYKEIKVTDVENNKRLVEVVNGKSLAEGEFRVDYLHGWLYVNPSVYLKKSIKLDFYSRGIELTPASRIYTIDENGCANIEKTLQYYIDLIQKGCDFNPNEGLGEDGTPENIEPKETYQTILEKIHQWFIYYNDKNHGKADLISGTVPSSQLPSYVDDIIEGTYNTVTGVFTPSNGTNGKVKEKGKIYLDINTGEQYRWSGSQYILITSKSILDSINLKADKITNGGFIAGGAKTGGIENISIGDGIASTGEFGVVIGSEAEGASNCVAIGATTTAGADKSVAIGYGAESVANNAVQIGDGSNSTKGSLQFRNYKLVLYDETNNVYYIPDIGKISKLPNNKTNVVDAIINVNNTTQNIDTKLGDTKSLVTTDKTNLVSAVNEIHNDIPKKFQDALTSESQDDINFTTPKKVVDFVNKSVSELNDQYAVIYDTTITPDGDDVNFTSKYDNISGGVYAPNVEIIKQYGFFNCIFPEIRFNCLKDIGTCSFQNCANLQTINLPDTLETIGSFVFSGCNQLKTIELGSNVQTISSSAFSESSIDTIIIKQTENSIEGAPWGAENARIIWTNGNNITRYLYEEKIDSPSSTTATLSQIITKYEELYVDVNNGNWIVGYNLPNIILKDDIFGEMILPSVKLEAAGTILSSETFYCYAKYTFQSNIISGKLDISDISVTPLLKKAVGTPTSYLDVNRETNLDDINIYLGTITLEYTPDLLPDGSTKYIYSGTEITNTNTDLALLRICNSTALTEQILNKAPISHSSAELKYGVGNESKYGHIRLSDAYDYNYTVDNGIAITPYALASVHGSLNTVVSQVQSNLSEQNDNILMLIQILANTGINTIPLLEMMGNTITTIPDITTQSYQYSDSNNPDNPLKGIVYAPNLETVESRSIDDNSGMTTIIMPKVKIIKSQGFWASHGLKTVFIPNTCTSLATNAFSMCGNLTNIYIDNVEGTFGDIATDSSLPNLKITYLRK